MGGGGGCGGRIEKPSGPHMDDTKFGLAVANSDHITVYNAFLQSVGAGGGGRGVGGGGWGAGDGGRGGMRGAY